MDKEGKIDKYFLNDRIIRIYAFHYLRHRNLLRLRPLMAYHTPHLHHLKKKIELEIVSKFSITRVECGGVTGVV